MTRAQTQVVVAAVVGSTYLFFLLGIFPLPSVLQDEIVPVLPFWALISFASYLLFKLGWGVMTFNDVPDAHQELMEQIDQARKDLRSMGVPVD